MIQTQTYGGVAPGWPDMDAVPARYRDRMTDLFDTWGHVSARNQMLSAYYDMKSQLKMLGISIPSDARFEQLNCVTGWCSKAVHAHVNRSTFDGYVFDGEQDAGLDALVRANRMRSLYKQALTGALVHGVAAITVMRGGPGQPAVKVRAHSATQFSVLWDKDEGRISCGVVLADVDRTGRASRYVAHFPDAVLTLSRHGNDWTCEVEPHVMGRPMMEVICHDPDLDRPLGHSMLTPELLGIVDKAMRDVMRMEVGAEFFTFPQRYAIGVAEELFGREVPAGDGEGADGDGTDGAEAEVVPDPVKKFQAYIGSIWAITRDENGEVPTVGQFSPTSAENFTLMFENDAQRFSGATNVPIGQLGVLSNTYTSSDALGAANDPLILEVEAINLRAREAMEEVARMMMAVVEGVPLLSLPEDRASVQAYMSDPSMPTIAARADAWTKLAGADKTIAGTRVYYEGVGLSQATIGRLEAERRQQGAIAALNAIADATGAARLPEPKTAEGGE
ncbi:MAG: phage portal protein [Collinsella sp.]|nr:phage portal protein [Collinsella sp.]